MNLIGAYKPLASVVLLNPFIGNGNIYETIDVHFNSYKQSFQ